MSRTKYFLLSYALLGAVVNTSALLNLATSISSIELVGIGERFVEFYRSVTRPILNLIPLPFHWSLPQWYMDLMSINAAVYSTSRRAVALSPFTMNPDSLERAPNTPGILAVKLVLAAIVFMLPVVFLPMYLLGEAGHIGMYFTSSNEDMGVIDMGPSGAHEPRLAREALGDYLATLATMALATVLASIALFFLSTGGPPS